MHLNNPYNSYFTLELLGDVNALWQYILFIFITMQSINYNNESENM